jgi:hypothetical protein
MLFPDIKTYFIEAEIENQADEEYVALVEKSRSIEELIRIVSEYNGQDDFEASEYILKQVCK